MNRRNWLSLFTSGLAGIVSGLVAAPAIRTVFGPFVRRNPKTATTFIAVSSLTAVPKDGRAIRAAVVMDAPKDAWNRLPPTQVGSVYLFREKGEIVAISTVCPHLGCGVEATNQGFRCPCHESSFDLSGGVQAGPSPRPLDRLETRVRHGQVELRFARFKTGIESKESV